MVIDDMYYTLEHNEADWEAFQVSRVDPCFFFFFYSNFFVECNFIFPSDSVFSLSLFLLCAV